MMLLATEIDYELRGGRMRVIPIFKSIAMANEPVDQSPRKKDTDESFEQSLMSRDWERIVEYMDNGASPEKRRRAVEAAIEVTDKRYASYNYFRLDEDFFPHCTTDEIETICVEAAKRRYWNVFKARECSRLTEASRRMIVNEFLNPAVHADVNSTGGDQLNDDSDCSPVWLSPEDQLDSVCHTVISRKLFCSAVVLLEFGKLNDTQRRSITGAWIQDYRDFGGDDNITDENDDNSGHDFVRRKRNEPSKHIWYMKDLAQHCSVVQLETICELAVRRRHWLVFAAEAFSGLNEDFRKRIVEEFLKKDKNDSKYVRTPVWLAPDDQIESVCQTAIDRKLWNSAKTLLNTDKLSNTQRRSIVEAAIKSYEEEESVPCELIIPHCTDDQLEYVFSWALDKCEWGSVSLLTKRGVPTSLRESAVEKACDSTDDHALLCLAKYASETQFKLVLKHFLRKSAGKPLDHYTLNNLVDKISESVTLSKFTHLWAQCLLHVLQSYTFRDFDVPEEEYDFLQEFNKGGITNIIYFFDYITYKVLLKSGLISSRNRVELILFAQRLEKVLQGVSEEELGTGLGFDPGLLQTVILIFYDEIPTEEVISSAAYMFPLCAQNVNSSLKSSTIRYLLLNKGYRFRWDIIKLASPLMFVWEEYRRWLFKEAVKHKQWRTVIALADHNLYDDEREWAVKRALREKQMEVLVKLSEHGLKDHVLSLVCSQMAVHADWNVFFQLCERSASAKVARQDLETMNISGYGASSAETREKHKVRVRQARRLERQISVAAKSLSNAIENGNWPAVLLHVQTHCSEKNVDTAVRAAIDKQAYHVVVQLVRLDMTTQQRDSLFQEAMRLRAWGIGRALLEQGVSVMLCEQALPDLVKQRQWVLVARVLEHPQLHDSFRRQVIKLALAAREESVVVHCIDIMLDNTKSGQLTTTDTSLARYMMLMQLETTNNSFSREPRLCVEEREKLFQTAVSEELWAIVKRLVEIKDATGTNHRDRALVPAVNQYRWDVVSHCQLYGADMDTKDAEGHNLIQQAAKQKDWRKVKELVKLGANQFPLDKDGYTVLHRAMEGGTYNTDETVSTAELLIQFHGDIHQHSPAKNADTFFKLNNKFKSVLGPTPLQIMISNMTFTHLIDCALWWGQDLGKYVADGEGKTALHAVCDVGLSETIPLLLARGCAPFAFNKYGHDLLYFAAMTEKGSPKLVAECIRLGVTTFQPIFNVHLCILKMRPSYAGLKYRSVLYELDHVTEHHPFDSVLLRKCTGIIPVMLYESGACSYEELYDLYKKWVCEFRPDYSSVHKTTLDLTECKRAYLTKIATTPRSLQSKCRLLISHCIGVCKPRIREKRILQLPILSDKMKDYVLFSDLTSLASTKMTTGPYSLQWMCRIRISLCIGVCGPGIREKRVQQLPIVSDEIKDYVLFGCLVRPDVGK